MANRAYSFVKRKPPKPKSGYTNFYINSSGKTGLMIGAWDYGLMEITPESIEFRDNARAKQGLKPADY